MDGDRLDALMAMYRSEEHMATSPKALPSPPRAVSPPRKQLTTVKSVPMLESLLPARKQAKKGRKYRSAMDNEALTENLVALRKQNFELEREARHLKAQVVLKDYKLLQKENEIENVLKKAIAGGDPQGITASLMHEKSMVLALKRRIKDMKDDSTAQRAEVVELKGQFRVTQAYELQVVASEFYNEVLRLRMFNALGRTANSHTKLSVLKEIRQLRKDSEALRADNVELNSRFTQMELMGEQKRRLEVKEFAARVAQLEVDLKKEHLLVSEMELIGEASRRELNKVIADTAGTRHALDESVGQISRLQSQLASAQAELADKTSLLRSINDDHQRDLERSAQFQASMEVKLSANVVALRSELAQALQHAEVDRGSAELANRQLQQELQASGERDARAAAALASATDLAARLQVQQAEAADQHAQETVELRRQIGDLQARLDVVASGRASPGPLSPKDEAAASELVSLQDQHDVVTRELNAAKAQYELIKAQLAKYEIELDQLKYGAEPAPIIDAVDTADNLGAVDSHDDAAAAPRTTPTPIKQQRSTTSMNSDDAKDSDDKKAKRSSKEKNGKKAAAAAATSDKKPKKSKRAAAS